MKETKQVPGSPEAGNALHAVMAAFEAFRDANDQRLAEIERKAAADVLLEEKVARIDAAVAGAQGRLDRVVSEGRRPSVSDRAAPSVSAFGRATSPLHGEETKAAFADYMRSGFGLEVKAGLSSASNSAGHIVPEQTERAIERRLMAASPMREIATVRTVASGTFRKPVSIAGIEAGWVAETAARPETDPATLALLEFPSADLYACPAATQALLDDALVDLDDWLAGEVEDAFAAQETAGGGRSLSWIARSRLDGDRWEGPEASADALRFRVRWLDGEVEVGTAEVAATALEVGGAALAALFPGGLAAARVAVAQWGDGWGWGMEATIPLA